MSNSNRFTIICPCCEAMLNIDAETGALLSHEEKQKELGSFEDMVKGLDKQKETRDQIFAQQMSSHKDRERLLAEKFEEAKKKAAGDTKIYRSEEHTSELQSRLHLVCRLLLEKKKQKNLKQ